MKKEFLLTCMLLMLSSCDFINTPPLPSSKDSSVESNTNNSVNSFVDSSFDSSESNNEKEDYKALVDRSKINYSTPLVNDPSHKINSLEVFEINDTHGAFYEDDSTGIARVKTCIETNSVDPYAVVKIANGDLMQGSAFSNLLAGEPAVASLNEMNFDCFVIGNHEFDWGLDNLACYKDGDLSNGELNCPFLGANIVNANGERPSWIEPYTVVEKGDKKVGIIGLIGDGLENSIAATSLGGYHFSDTVEAVNKYCKILQDEEKVDYIIVSSHAHDELKNQEYVNNNYNICLIVNGHDHRKINEYVTNKNGKNIPVIESNTKNITIAKATLRFDESNTLNGYNVNHYYPDSFNEDSNLKSIMNVYYSVVGSYQSKVIGYTPVSLSRESIGVKTATYIANKYDADLAIINTGGVRAEVYAGDITVGSIYDVFPFDNELYIATITGIELKKMIPEDSMYYYYYNNSIDKIGNGVTYDYYSIIDSKTYKVISVDYVATKDYMLKYFDESHGLITTGDYIRDCALENIQQNYKK